MTPTLAAKVVAHHRRHARPLPWRAARDPYAIWVCEIMAQQTRLATVIPYWERWLAHFPDVRALAAADQGDVLALWAGLGYYARARSLHRAARLVVERHAGQLPDDLDLLLALPGIGRYTAGAIASIAFGRRAPVVDGNVGRVFARLFAIEDDLRAPKTQKRLWALAESLVPDGADAGAFNEGLMDLGATICTPKTPACLACPLADDCLARRAGRQADLPVLSRRAPTPERTVELAFVTRADHTLLAGRRLESGLFGGLWELPEAHTLPVTLGAPLAEHLQKLTHRTFRYLVRHATLRRGADPMPAAPYEELRWLSPEALLQLGVSSATKALLATATAKGSPWPTRSARSTSSRKVSRSSSPASASSGSPSPTTRTSARRRSGPPKGSRS
jgi:A/G-specific adenine glycosylase